MKVSETQKGAIAENLICNWLMSESDGRFAPYRPVADDGGIDLLVFDRQTRRTLLLQVKSRTMTEAVARRHSIRFNVRCATFQASADFYIVGVLLREDLHMADAIWLIPSLVVDDKAVRSRKDAEGLPTRRVIACNPSPNTRDQWSSYMSATPAEFVQAVNRAFDSR